MLVHQKIYRNLTLVCTLIIFSFYWNVAEAQEKKSQLISVSFTNTPLIELVKQLKTKSSAHIYYQPEWLTGVVFTGSFSDKNMDDILEKVLDETGLVSITINNNFYIIPREQVAVHLKKMNNLFGGSNQELVKDFTLIGSPGDIGKYSKNRISGIVLDGKNGESLVGSTVQVLNTSIYGVSGSRGNYYFEVPSGTYQIKVTSVGYEVQLLTIKVLGPGTLNIEMFEESHAINEVVILSEKVDRNVTRDQMSMVELDAKSIKNLPSMIGERDLIKSFTIMPGVKSVGEFGAGINVRGGGEDQNLYLLENSPLFNTSHVMGLLSAVNPDAVTSVALYKGHIPPEYGERVSSVMDINFNGREVKKFKGTGGIGIYSSRLMFEVPLYKNIVSLKLGGRTSYSEYLLTKMPDYNLQNSSASFYDLNGMLSINIKNNPISLFVYRSYDYFKYANNFSYQYGNQLLSANWQHIFNPSFNTTLSGSYSSYSLTNKKRKNQLLRKWFIPK
ncbi:MAG: carboxypeptidase-like regulatory domain-containing protein [Salinivirgaceae bacterium]